MERKEHEYRDRSREDVVGKTRTNQQEGMKYQRRNKTCRTEEQEDPDKIHVELPERQFKPLIANQF